MIEVYQDILHYIIFPIFKHPSRSRFKSLFIDILKNSVILPEEYINIQNIIYGIDKRTTILIKNFPSEQFDSLESLKKFFNRFGNINFIYKLKHSNKGKIPYLIINCVNNKSIIDIIQNLNKIYNNLIIIYSNIQGRKSLIQHFFSKKK